jgi:hypothetical protein
MPKLQDRVQETTTTTGTGSFALNGAVTGYITFNSGFSNGDIVWYVCDNGSGDWEIGYGTVGTGTLTRTVFQSSNANALVPFAAGAKRIFCTAPYTYLLPDQTGNTGKILSTDGATPSWITAPTGTVTAVSVATANGLAGTSSGGATPALTLSTTVTGVLKGNGTAISAASAGTDYAPATSGSSILYGNGAGGFSNVTIGSGVSFSGGTLSATGTGGTVTSVSGTGTVSGISLSGTVTSSGSLTLGGSLDLSSPPAIGGTTPNTGAFTRVTVTGSTAPANGMYLPGTNILGFATNSSERVRIDASGNVGIGTSSPSSFSGYTTVSVNNATNGGIYNVLVNGTETARLQAYSGVFNVAAKGASTVLTFETNGSERMRLDTSGNLGLGVTPSAWRTDVSFKAIQMPGGTFAAYVAGGLDPTPNIAANGYVDSGGTWRYINSRAASWYIQNGGMHAWYNAPSGTAGNAISFTQAMTLDASGNLLVGTTSNVTAGGLIIYPAGGAAEQWIGHTNGTSSGVPYSAFYYNGTRIGSITQNGTTGVLYNITSDQRLKENIADAPGALDSVNAIKVRSFDWKADGSHVDYGYIAQELLEVVPEAVSAPADPEEMMGVDFGKLTPRLVKAVQELSSQVSDLKAELNELKKRIN